MKSILKRIDQSSTRAELTTLLDIIETDIDGLDWTDAEFEQILTACEMKTRFLTQTTYTTAH